MSLSQNEFKPGSLVSVNDNYHHSCKYQNCGAAGVVDHPLYGDTQYCPEHLPIVMERLESTLVPSEALQQARYEADQYYSVWKSFWRVLNSMVTKPLFGGDEKESTYLKVVVGALILWPLCVGSIMWLNTMHKVWNEYYYNVLW